jgi:hypothetical protein
MSTRRTLRYEGDEETNTGFHLWTDYVDTYENADTVHLSLDGVSFEATCYCGRPSIELILPRKMAEELGLVRPVADSQ